MNPAANANKMFMAIENVGGFSGSQRHPGGVHVRMCMILRHSDTGVGGFWGDVGGEK